jgi:hypothetical protein
VGQRPASAGAPVEAPAVAWVVVGVRLLVQAPADVTVGVQQLVGALQRDALTVVEARLPAVA